MENNIEKFIQLTEAKIKDRQEAILKLTPEQYVSKAVISGVIIGLESSLSTFLLLNNR